jgi:hypothetical protein
VNVFPNTDVGLPTDDPDVFMLDVGRISVVEKYKIPKAVHQLRRFGDDTGIEVAGVAFIFRISVYSNDSSSDLMPTIISFCFLRH